MKTGKLMALALALAALALAATGCKKAGASPTGAAKAYFEAAKKKDVQAIKSVLSKASLSLMEQAARQENKSLDDWMKERSAQPPTGDLETRNEKINGDTGTLEVKDEGKWMVFSFVKEDGVWKLDVTKNPQPAGETGGGGAQDGGGMPGGGMPGGGTQGGGEHGGH